MLRKAVLAAALVLFGAWAAANFGRLTGIEEGLIRFVLGTLFATLILLRPKPAGSGARPPSVLIPAVAVAGALLAVLGIVFNVHQFEWLGMVLLFYACLRWSLPDRYGRDILIALFLLYWIHPLPGQVFGKLQMAMQVMSVEASEFVLQALNVRCWADGLTIHLSHATFGVPEACSGMRTGVTVGLCTLGVCLLYRFRWFETLAFVALGLAQVLLLNIARVVSLALWSSRMPPEWSATVLHDTLGVFLLVCLFAVQGEATWWRAFRARRKMLREGRASGHLERPDRASRLPRIWRLGLRWSWAAALVVILAGATFIGIRKARPAHRAAMIGGVVDALMIRSPDAAERALAAALELRPGSRDLQGKRARLYVARQRYAEALDQFDRLPPASLSMEETILKSWVLMATGRAEEAAALVDALPANVQRNPGVAIVRAEYAAKRDRADEAARNVVLAARSHMVIDRVRALFPYLAAREQWLAIAGCDSHVRHRQFASALIAVHAHLRLRETSAAARILQQGLEDWPDEPRFLTALFALASGAPGGNWERAFAESLEKNLPALDAARLATYLSYCFELRRPDLGWRVFARLRELDSRDPALALAAVRYGGVWFAFRRRQLGLEARNAFELLDLRPLYRVTRGVAAMQPFWSRVPLADELGEGDPTAVRRRYLDEAIAELERRDREGALTPTMEMSYPVALGMAGRFAEAHAQLDELLTRYPDRDDAIMLQHAVFYDQVRAWQESYEALRAYDEITPIPTLNSRLMLVNAMMNVNLAVGALDVLARSREIFPGAAQLEIAEAAILAGFGFREEALFILGREGVGGVTPGMAQMLLDTGRARAGEDMARALGAKLDREGREKDVLSAPPAEMSVMRLWPTPPTEKQMADEAARHAAEAVRSTSPFVRGLYELLAKWYAAGGAGATSDPARWAAVGRNDLESAAALHRLTALLATQKDHERALVSAREAVRRLPRSAVLHRTLVALSEGDGETVARAREACPADAEIWLAALVARLRDEGPGPWVLAEMQSAAAAKTYPPGTMVRAGQFLLRNNLPEAAAVAARDAVARGRGCLPALALAANCALRLGDVSWTMKSALEAAENARDPTVFYELIVRIKAREGAKDVDLIAALEFLKERFPESTQWAERLGFAYFGRRDLARAMTVLDEAFELDARGMRPSSLLLAAEAARVQGHSERAVEILETARALYPASTNVLNNLVYTLAGVPGGLPRAREMLPALLALDNRSYAALDTAAVVYMKSGDLDLAREYMEKALAVLEEGAYGDLEVRLNAAELEMSRGNYGKAQEIVDAVRRNARRSDAVEARARDMHSRLKLLMKERARSSP